MPTLQEATRLDWSTHTSEETLSAIETTSVGLSSQEIEKRRTLFGKNEIAQGKPTPWYILLGRQFTNPLIYILLVAAAVTGLAGHLNDVIIILIVLVVNAGIGFYQERKAERAINNIKGMTAPLSRVRRNGEIQSINAEELVPGDILLLEEGDRITADARLILAVRLRVEEAIFTGESLAAEKGVDRVEKPAALADKTNMVFMGTHVTAGRAEAVVTATAMGTELGKIAGLVQTAEEVLTPLTKKLEEFSSFIAKAVIGICGIIFLSSYIVYKQPFQEVLLNAIALAVSAIPEGLPVVITLVLAIGVRRMAQHKALIRKLPTVETLGSASVICTDKTGTLTRNEMVVTKIFTGGEFYGVTGEGYSCDGKILLGDQPVTKNETLSQFLETAVHCNNAQVKATPEGGWNMIGDGTEGALMALAGKYDRSSLEMRDRKRRQAEIPFDSKVKFMVTVTPESAGYRAHLKGSLESVLEHCSHFLSKSGLRPLTPEDREKIVKVNLSYADEALRVLGLASKDLPKTTVLDAFVEEDQGGYTFLGLAGMMDLPRPEVIDAIAKCRKAGIRVVMITGDHAATAKAVGKKVGIFDEGMKMLTGEELQKLDENALKNIVESVAIYARTSPEDKMRIIQALQSHGHVVSMTGDGVNDAPALTRADIGVAMGRSGTDVAREAAGMVLVDDNFASIVAAVEEGRIIFNNLRKALGFLVSTNAGEVATLLTASLMGFATPLRAVQVLWVNLVTDGFTTIALGVDPAEGDEMTVTPRKPSEPLLSKHMTEQVLLVSVLMAIGTLLAYRLGLHFSAETGAAPEMQVRHAQTMAFGTMVFFQLFNIFNCRSYEKSLFRVGIFSNMTLVGAVLLASLLQLGAMYLPFMQNLMGTAVLNGKEILVVFLISFTVIPGVEILKMFDRHMDGKRKNA